VLSQSKRPEDCLSPGGVITQASFLYAALMRSRRLRHRIPMQKRSILRPFPFERVGRSQIAIPKIRDEQETEPYLRPDPGSARSLKLDRASPLGRIGRLAIDNPSCRKRKRLLEHARTTSGSHQESAGKIRGRFSGLLRRAAAAVDGDEDNCTGGVVANDVGRERPPWLANS
jgi:hypothetical protein